MTLCYILNCFEWFSSINPIEILIGGIVSAFVGYLVSIYYAREVEKIKSDKLKKEYEPITGNYSADNGFATAKINYLIDNQLEIEVTTHINYDSPNKEPFPKDQIQVWSGDISMDAITHGFVVWAYRKPNHLIGSNGFKRIIINKDLKGFTLVGEQGYGFGTEKFTNPS